MQWNSRCPGKKASSSRPAQHRGSRGKPRTQGSLSRYQNKDEQQTPPSLQKGCGSAPGTGTEKSNLSWDLTATEESHGESQSKFTQAPRPKISEKKKKMWGLSKDFRAGKWKLHLSLSCWPELQAVSSGAFGSSLFSKAFLPSSGLLSAMDLAPCPLKRPRFLSFSPLPRPLASCWDLECATLQVFSFNDN